MNDFPTETQRHKGTEKERIKATSDAERRKKQVLRWVQDDNHSIEALYQGRSKVFEKSSVSLWGGRF
jgi:hypothetical protein